MTKEQIAAAILETEKTLANLREKLKEPEKLESFKTGDLFDCESDVPIIVAELWSDGENKFHVIGNDRGCNDYLRVYSDCRNGLSKTEMQNYLDEKIQSGWKYVGNISEKFDSIVREMIGE